MLGLIGLLVRAVYGSLCVMVTRSNALIRMTFTKQTISTSPKMYIQFINLEKKKTYVIRFHFENITLYYKVAPSKLL